MGNSETKQNFQETIINLLETDCSANDESFWCEILLQPISLFEIFAAISNNSLLSILEKYPGNFYSIVSTSTTIIQRVANGHLHFQRNLVLNSLRFLLRIFHFVLERPEYRFKFWEDNTAFRILEGLMGLMFAYGFGIERTSTVSRFEFDPSRLWAPGLYATEVPSVSAETLENRSELMKCLLFALTSPLYVPLRDFSEYTDPWAWVCVSREIWHGRDAFFSLLNTALSYNPQGYIPYSGYFIESENIPSLACQLLLVVLDSKVPSIEEIEQNNELKLGLKALQEVNSRVGDSLSNQVSMELGNVFRECLSEMSDFAQFEFVFDNMCRLLTGVIDAKMKYMLPTVKNISYYQEVLLLFWNFIEGNPDFEEYVCKSKRITKIIDILFILMNENMDTPGSVGVIQLAVFILLHLSAKREFNLKMILQPTRPSISPGDYYFDQLIVLSYTILTSKPNMAPMSLTILTILQNISPYSKLLGRLGSQKLMGLFQHFSSSKFIFQHINNHQLLKALIEIINSRLQYQWEGSAELVHAIISQKHIYERLVNLELVPPEDITWEINEEWYKWKDSLPLIVLEGLYNYLLPKIEKFIETKEYVLDYELLEYLKDVTMVGVFPVPHKLYYRKYQSHADSTTWFTSFIWGVLIMRNQRFLTVNFNAIKLFKIEMRREI